MLLWLAGQPKYAAIMNNYLQEPRSESILSDNLAHIQSHGWQIKLILQYFIKYIQDTDNVLNKNS